MKKTYKTKIILLGIIFIYPNLLLSHGGGLDKYGCHNETKTGGYHCHRSSYTSPPSNSSKAYSPNLIRPSSKTSCKVTIGNEYYEFDPESTSGVNLQFSDKSGKVKISCK